MFSATVVQDVCNLGNVDWSALDKFFLQTGSLPSVLFADLENSLLALAMHNLSVLQKLLFIMHSLKLLCSQFYDTWRCPAFLWYNFQHKIYCYKPGFVFATQEFFLNSGQFPYRALTALASNGFAILYSMLIFLSVFFSWTHYRRRLTDLPLRNQKRQRSSTRRLDRWRRSGKTWSRW